MVISKLCYGFDWGGKSYYFKEKRLYQLPYTKGLRSYSEKEIKPQRIKNVTYYRLSGDLINYTKILRPILIKKLIKEVIPDEYPF